METMNELEELKRRKRDAGKAYHLRKKASLTEEEERWLEDYLSNRKTRGRRPTPRTDLPGSGPIPVPPPIDVSAPSAVPHPTSIPGTFAPGTTGQSTSGSSNQTRPAGAGVVSPSNVSNLPTPLADVYAVLLVAGNEYMLRNDAPLCVPDKVIWGIVHPAAQRLERKYLPSGDSDLADVAVVGATGGLTLFTSLRIMNMKKPKKVPGHADEPPKKTDERAGNTETASGEGTKPIDPGYGGRTPYA